MGRLSGGIDGSLTHRVTLQCLGGFAIASLYGLPRPTVDIDYLTVAPVDEYEPLQVMAGEGSRLHKKHGVYLQQASIVTVPESYEERVLPMFPGFYERLTLMGLEAYDLALSKLERNSARDREDVKFLAGAARLDPMILEQRCYQELRPYLSNMERHDLTMRLWLAMLAETA